MAALLQAWLVFGGLQAVKGSAMEKALCWGAMGIAGLLLILFLLDSIMGMPFGGVSITADVFAILACGVLGYLSWNALRGQR